MVYRVFLVEDEIVTREGIRDNVDWESAGFEFCGEATDGEAALQKIEESKPDVVITDIKMPFMDGLQLSKVLHENMPWIKIIILSGHDEFGYAQSAIQLGVTEYLLKPISARELQDVLTGMVDILDKENKERQTLKNLQAQFQDSLVLSREKFLLDLLLGKFSPAEAIEQSQQLGLDILAKYYLVALIQIHICHDTQSFDYREYQKIEQIIVEFAGNNLDVFLTKKDFEELVLFIKGADQEQLWSEGKFLVGLIKEEVEKQVDCTVDIRFGSIENRLGNVHHSFLQTLVGPAQMQELGGTSENLGLVTLDRKAIEDFFKFGSLAEFDDFFDAVIAPIAENILDSRLLNQYLFVDLVMQLAEISKDARPELTIHEYNIDEITSRIRDQETLKSEVLAIASRAIEIRNQIVNPERTRLVQQTRRYLEQNFTDSELKMSKVARHYNLSPGYFSTIFRKETGQTFREYLTELRINRAREILRNSNLGISEISEKCGYNDPHYFSHVFKRITSFTPSQFRKELLPGQKEE